MLRLLVKVMFANYEEVSDSQRLTALSCCIELESAGLKWAVMLLLKAQDDYRLPL